MNLLSKRVDRDIIVNDLVVPLDEHAKILYEEKKKYNAEEIVNLLNMALENIGLALVDVHELWRIYTLECTTMIQEIACISVTNVNLLNE